MASIDKTYCTKEEYLKIREWWINTYDEQVKIFGDAINMHPFYVFDSDVDPSLLKEDTSDIDSLEDNEICLWSTDGMTDLWLSKNCDIPVIQERLKEQYSEDWIGFTEKDKLDFDDPPCIMKIERGDDTIYFFKDSEEEGYVETLDSLLVYGTTEFFKVVSDAMDNIFSVGSNNLVTYYRMYGLDIKNIGGKTDIIDKKEVSVNTLSRKLFELPDIRYSMLKEDFEKHDKFGIYLSQESEIYALTDYKDWEKITFECLMFELPEFITKFIKK